MFDLLAATGLRISEAIALRWSDLVLDERSPRLRVSRSIVRGVTNAPKSPHCARLVPLTFDLAATLLRAAAAGRARPRARLPRP
jgi:integrase